MEWQPTTRPRGIELSTCREKTTMVTSNSPVQQHVMRPLVLALVFAGGLAGGVGVDRLWMRPHTLSPFKMAKRPWPGSGREYTRSRSRWRERCAT
jgi:hypothetical protein